MDGYDIRRIMASKKITGTSIARDLGVAVPTVSEVIHGKSTSLRISTAIAKKLKMPLAELFPRYAQGVSGKIGSGKTKTPVP